VSALLTDCAGGSQPNIDIESTLVVRLTESLDETCP
jgi:hypothetical protein